ncbi:MAG: HTH domain-containing protein [Bacilli bacterium]
MGVNYFTDKQIRELKANKYVKRVSNKSITYTEECRQQMHEYSIQGLSAKMSCIKLGFNLATLGESRIYNLQTISNNQAERMEGFKDTRNTNSGRPSLKNLSSKEIIKRQNERIEYLKQELEFVKKNDLIERKALDRYLKKQSVKNSKKYITKFPKNKTK